MATRLYRDQVALRPGQRLQEIHLVQSARPLPRSIRSPTDLAVLVAPHLQAQHREVFLVVPLNAKHQPLGLHVVSIGTVSSSLVHPREVFLPALLTGASAIAVAHGHPSGDPSPSSEDREVTDRLRRAGELLGIEVVDHLVFGQEEFFTFTGGCFLPYPPKEAV